MILKWLFDRLVSFLGLLFLWPVLVVVAILVKIKMPGGPVLFVHWAPSSATTSWMSCPSCGTCSSATRLISAEKKFSCNLKRTGSYPYEREAEQHVARPGVE